MGNTVEKCTIFPAPSVALGNGQNCANIIWDQRDKGSPAGGVRRPFLWFQVPAAQVTIMYFHANAEDLAGIENWLCEFAQRLCVNMLAVEYPGYGLLQVPEIIEDMETVGDIVRGIDNIAVHALRFLVEAEGIASDRIMLHGRSLGCGPALRLAKYARDRLQLDLGGVVLQSPSISVQQVASDWLGPIAALLTPAYYHNLSVLTRLCCDAVPASNVRQWIPILIVHGEQDQMIAPYHAQTLYQEAVAQGHPAVEMSLSPQATHEHWDLCKDLVCPIGHFIARQVLGAGSAGLEEVVSAEVTTDEQACRAKAIQVTPRPGRVFQDGETPRQTQTSEALPHGNVKLVEAMMLGSKGCLEELCLLPL